MIDGLHQPRPIRQTGQLILAGAQVPAPRGTREAFKDDRRPNGRSQDRAAPDE
jgi:hypothetical protein